MNTYSAEVDSLARQIEKDIEKRGLGPGDRYFTGVEVGELMDVSAATANRAMSLMVERDLLVRRRRSGTFVGAKFGDRRKSSVMSVFVMIPDVISQDLPATDLVQGIRKAIPGANIHFCFLPETDRLDYVKDLLKDSIDSGQIVGVVPISCGHVVYRHLVDSGIPAVVLGSLFEETDQLGSVDVDEQEVARLLVSHLFGKGHKKIAVIDNSRGCPGDHKFSDGVCESATMAGASPDSILWRFLPDDSVIAGEVSRLIASQDDLTGFLARSPRLARAVKEAIESSDLPANRFEVVFQGLHGSDDTGLGFTYVQPKGSFQSMSTQAGEMLRLMASNPDYIPEHIVSPVELLHPS